MSTRVELSAPEVEGRASAGPERPESDGIRGWVVVVVVLGAIVVAACGVSVAWTLATSFGESERAGRWSAPSADMQAIEMSLLPRVDAERDRRALPDDATSEPRRSEREVGARLQSYGYSDRAHAIVHIPLERAKQLYLEREHAAAARGAAPAPEAGSAREAVSARRAPPARRTAPARRAP
ncbi:MAG TPA: hypothetical protein VMG12_23670 [Polyangiaceae bacterium]|nr:hypothetical protein [Polyangiaceae bacterium]